MIFENKTILVTGGTGSMGKTFVHRVLSGELGTPKKVIVFSRDEAKQHHMRLAYMDRRTATDEVIYQNAQEILNFQIGDIRDYDSVLRAVSDAEVIVHAAALKQVPTCEYFPEEAVRTNVLGAQNLVRAVQANDGNVEVVEGFGRGR